MSVLMKRTIGEIAAANPDAERLFEILGIDYSCHGNLSLREACGAVGLDPEKVHRSIDQLPRGAEVNWLEQPVSKLLEHLRDDSHPALGSAIRAAAAALAAHCAICSSYPDKVARLRVAFGALADRLGPHMSREDHILFPLIEHLDGCWTRAEHPTIQLAGGVGGAVQTLILDHGTMIAHLDEVNDVVEEIIDQPMPCRQLIESLRALDHELREHIHLENNVLFPRALALDAAAVPEHAMG
jgi:regulator of cell morphogenesis and NO signaling